MFGIRLSPNAVLCFRFRIEVEPILIDVERTIKAATVARV